jgi:hypothetical protein
MIQLGYNLLEPARNAQKKSPGATLAHRAERGELLESGIAIGVTQIMVAQPAAAAVAKARLHHALTHPDGRNVTETVRKRKP